MDKLTPVVINLKPLLEGIRKDIREQLAEFDDAMLVSVLDQIAEHCEYGELIVNHGLWEVLSLAFVYEARQEMSRRLDSTAGSSEAKANLNPVGNEGRKPAPSGVGRGGRNL